MRHVDVLNMWVYPLKHGNDIYISDPFMGQEDEPAGPGRQLISMCLLIGCHFLSPTISGWGFLYFGPKRRPFNNREEFQMNHFIGYTLKTAAIDVSVGS